MILQLWGTDFHVELLFVLTKLKMLKLSGLKCIFPVLLAFPISVLTLVSLMLSDLFQSAQLMICLLGSWASSSVPGTGWTPMNEAGVCPPGAHALEQNFSALCWNPLPIIRNRTTITGILVSQWFLFKTLFPSLHPLTSSNIYLELEQIFKYPHINTYYLHSHTFALVKGSSWHLVINCSPPNSCHSPKPWFYEH